jgi:hypothetical protein
MGRAIEAATALDGGAIVEAATDMEGGAVGCNCHSYEEMNMLEQREELYRLQLPLMAELNMLGQCCKFRVYRLRY